MSSELQDGNGDWVDDKFALLPDGYAQVTGADMRECMASDLFVFSNKVWRNFKDYGLPHGAGYMNERKIVLVCIEMWEQACRFAQNWEIKKRMK